MKTIATRQALAPHSLVAAPFRRLIGDSVTRWIRNSGFYWAADRCKTIVQHLLKLRAGEETTPPAWISRRYLAYSERTAFNASENKFFQLVQCWRIYTLFGEGLTLSAEAIQKFEHACLDLLPQQAGVLSGDTVNPRLSVDLSWFAPFARGRTLLPEVRLPECIPVKNPLALRSHAPDGTLSRQWEELRFDTNTMAHLRQNVWKIDVEQMPFALRQLPLLSFDLPRELKTDATFGTIGRVHARVQKDGKCRFFYSPPDWVQFLMGDWGKSLFDSLRSIKQDCTFDQERGVKRVREWLREGKTVHAFDLSSATDRFPLAFTRSVLTELSATPNMRMWADTFCLLSRVPVAVQYGLSDDLVSSHLPAVLDEGHVKWNVGQPLGMLPSFAAFALSHHWLVRACFGEGDPSDLPYVILGDDLVIADESAARKYQEYVRHLGVEISLPKSLTGCLGEFAGRIIGSEVYEFKLKYFPVTPRTLLSAISLLGPRALKAMKQTRLRDVLALIPTPRTPDGVNPGGFPKAKVDVFLTEYFASAKDAVVDGELWVDGEPQVSARLGALGAYTFHTSPSAHCWSVAPRGAATIGYGGAPMYGPRKGSNTWKWSPYLSRAWITRVKRAAKAANLM